MPGMGGGPRGALERAWARPGGGDCRAGRRESGSGGGTRTYDQPGTRVAACHVPGPGAGSASIRYESARSWATRLAVPHDGFRADPTGRLSSGGRRGLYCGPPSGRSGAVTAALPLRDADGHGRRRQEVGAVRGPARGHGSGGERREQKCSRQGGGEPAHGSSSGLVGTRGEHRTVAVGSRAAAFAPRDRVDPGRCADLARRLCPTSRREVSRLDLEVVLRTLRWSRRPNEKGCVSCAGSWSP